MAYKGKHQERGGHAQGHARQIEREQVAATSVPSSGRWLVTIGIAFGVSAIGGVSIWGVLRDGGTPMTPTPGTSAPAVSILPPPKPTPTAPVVTALSPPAPGTRVPLNDTDPFTGKPVTPNSPTVTHKGYVIAFCCENSSGYRGGWARMSDSERDAVVRRYLE